MSDEQILIELNESDVRGIPKYMYDRIIEKNYTEVLELGVREGFSTRGILLAMRTINGHLTSIDTYTSIVGNQRVDELNLRKYWTFLVDDPRTHILELAWNKEVDLLFVDSSHEYSRTVEELERFSPWVRYEILLHDTKSFPDVRKAIEKFMEGNNKWVFTEVEGVNPHGLGQLIRVVPIK